ncbi:hypothetical protein EYF80_018704 [Liparis tanakae]|uniref:Secreted protein n=1 Tax=Liparis tanakae TaxID=230148 RepID=A0A4Z2I1E1_9TELE|nr:hypothetical protein EYF80_018704 [Liparis tanakae]
MNILIARLFAATLLAAVPRQSHKDTVLCLWLRADGNFTASTTERVDLGTNDTAIVRLSAYLCSYCGANQPTNAPHESFSVHLCENLVGALDSSEGVKRHGAIRGLSRRNNMSLQN